MFLPVSVRNLHPSLTGVTSVSRTTVSGTCLSSTSTNETPYRNQHLNWLGLFRLVVFILGPISQHFTSSSFRWFEMTHKTMQLHF